MNVIQCGMGQNRKPYLNKQRRSITTRIITLFKPPVLSGKNVAVSGSGVVR